MNTVYKLHTKNWTELHPNEVKKKVWKDFTDHWKSRIKDVEKQRRNYIFMPKSRQSLKLMTTWTCLRLENVKLSLSSCAPTTLSKLRHENISREDRLCQLCDLGKIEDEDHFIMECPKYDQIRHESPINFGEYTNTEALFRLEPLTF